MGLNTNLETLSFQLKTTGRFVFQSNTHLKRLEGFGVLEETEDIIIQQMDELTHIRLPTLGSRWFFIHRFQPIVRKY